jgi:hypothetical protein
MVSPPATPTPSRGASTAGSYPVHLHRRRGIRRAARARSKMKLAYFLMDEEERRCKTDELQFEVIPFTYSLCHELPCILCLVKVKFFKF